MTVTISAGDKTPLILDSPVMNASGILGFADEYRDLVAFDKLGAFVTNPITWGARTPATGTHTVALEAGVLVHTGLPNPGLSKAITQYHEKWARLGTPIIVHLIASSADDVRRSIGLLDETETVDAIEFGLHDDWNTADAAALVRAASVGEKPLLVRLPFNASLETAGAMADAGANSLVVSAPPRGTTADKGGKLMSGRLYSPTLLPMVLRQVGQMARTLEIPVVGAGGIHSPDDARRFMEAGAAAIQVDSAVWAKPSLLDLIARDLGGLQVTRPAGAFPDEWYPGMGDNTMQNRRVT